VGLFLTLWMILSSTGHAYADETTVQVSPLGLPIDTISSNTTITVQTDDSGTVTLVTATTIIEEAQTALNNAGNQGSSEIIAHVQSVTGVTTVEEAVQIVEDNPITSAAVEDATTAIQTAQTTIANANTAIDLAETAQLNAVEESAQTLVAEEAVDVATTEVTTAQDELNAAILNNQAAEDNLNTQTSITIAAQQANDDARDANDIAQSAVGPAIEAVEAQILVVAMDQAAKDAAQAVVDANTTSGLKVEVYNIQGQNNAPVLPANATPIHTTNDTNGINENWGGGVVAGSNRAEDVIVIYSGQWTPQTTGTQYLHAPGDDGVRLYLDGELVINDWYDKGGGGSTADVETTAGVSKQFVMWYYENGGGAWVALMSYTDTGWQIIPGSELSQSSATPEQIAALNSANASLASSTAMLNQLQNIADAAQQSADDAYQTYMDANQEMMVQESIQAPIQQEVWDTRNVLTDAQENLTIAQETLTIAQSFLETQQLEKSTAIQTAEITLATANSLVTTATNSVTTAIEVIQTAVHVVETTIIPVPPTPEPPNPPVEPPVIVDPPVEPPVVVDPPVEPPVIEPPVEEPPTEEPPTEEPPVEEPVIEEPTIEEPTQEEVVDTAVEDALDDGKITAGDAEEILDALNSDGEVTSEEVNDLSDALGADGELTNTEKDLIAEALLESVTEGETLTSEQIKDAGIDFKDLPPETPVDIRTDENGNAVIITAEVAAQVELLQNPSELLSTAFSDPGAALAALGSIGADMSDAEREEATDMVVATVVAAGAAINAAAVAATGGSTGGSSSGGGSSGGGSGANSPGSRGGRKW
jgi:predicted XRE-type DNA-binding protein